MEVGDRAERRDWITAYRALGDAGAVCRRRFGVSRPTLRKWLRRNEREGEAGLHARSCRPHDSPALKVGETQQALILCLRQERRLGVKRLRNELQRLHELRLSRVQMDTCKIRADFYRFTAIDDCSRFVVAGLARRRSADAALAFLDQVLEEMPFSIQRVQTDRGAEFFAEEVQRRLMGEAIRFRPIPPRSPHLNGKVERAQRTILEEFWAMADPKAADVGEQLARWAHHYNWHRSHESLHGDTPVDRVCQRADKTPLWAAVCEAYDPAKERIQVRGMPLR